MCDKCSSSDGWGCYCNGGSVFAVCPASKGFWCSVCEHGSTGLFEGDSSGAKALSELLNPELIAEERKKYKAMQAEKEAQQ